MQQNSYPYPDTHPYGPRGLPATYPQPMAGQQNPGCISPDKYLKQLLSGDDPDFGLKNELDLVISLTNSQITFEGLQKLGETVETYNDLVLPHLQDGANSRIRNDDVVQLDGTTGVGQLIINTPLDALGYALTYQVAPNNTVLTPLSVTESFFDNSNINAGVQTQIDFEYLISCLNSYLGAQVVRLLHAQIRNAAGDAASCQGAYGRVAHMGRPTEDATVNPNTLDFLGAPGSVVTVRWFHYGNPAVRDIVRGRPNVQAKAQYKNIARLIALENKAYQEAKLEQDQSIEAERQKLAKQKMELELKEQKLNNYDLTSREQHKTGNGYQMSVG